MKTFKQYLGLSKMNGDSQSTITLAKEEQILKNSHLFALIYNK